jgi:hypothetical protein
VKCPVLSPGVRTHCSDTVKISQAGPKLLQSFIGACALGGRGCVPSPPSVRIVGYDVDWGGGGGCVQGRVTGEVAHC